MKKIIFVVAFLFLITQFAYAHPPSIIDAKYDLKSKVLEVTVRHRANNALSHFIKKIEIYLNDKEIEIKDFKKQKKEDSQSAKFKIRNAKPNDVILVTAVCSITGKQSKKVRVKK